MKMAAWFNKKLTDDQKAILIEKTSHIPSEALIDITERVINHEKFFPTPAQLDEGWEGWKKSNPHKVERKYTERVWCDECGGTGLIGLKWIGKKTGLPYEGSARCARCNNWRAILGENCQLPITTRSELMRMGYELDPKMQRPDAPPRQHIQSGVDNIVNRVGKQFPDY